VIRSSLVAVALNSLAVVASAAEPPLPKDVSLRDLPDLFHAEHYRIDPCVQAAAAIQALGREKGIAALTALAEDPAYDREIIVLCRMLFTAKPDAEFRRPLLGAPVFLGETAAKDWPHLPLEWVDGVPFVIVPGYNLFGVPEFGPDYLRYCRRKAVWKDEKIILPREDQKKKALGKLLASPKWKKPLQDHEKLFLARQLEPVPAAPPEIPPAGLRATIRTRERVTMVAISPDGRLLAVAEWDGRLQLLDSVTHRPVTTIEMGAPADEFAFSPDGTALATRSSLRSVIWVWDVKSGQVRTAIRGDGPLFGGPVFSPDGKTLAAGDDNGIALIWDFATGREVAALDPREEWVGSLAFAPDGKTLALAGYTGRITLWDVKTWKEHARLTGHTEPVTALAFSPDGSVLASASGDHTVRLWDPAAGKNRVELKGHTDLVTAVAFSPDGRLLASSGHDGAVILWDVASGKERVRYQGHESGVETVAFSPDGKTIASGGHDRTVQLWIVPGKR
jgi:Tol biopolymer transport system component